MSLLQIQSSPHNQTLLSLSFSSSLSHSSSLHFNHSSSSSTTLTHAHTCFHPRLSVVTCSISNIHSYGTVDYERRPIVRWNDVYRRISLNQNPQVGSAEVLNQWENEGRHLTKWELSRVVKELRKYKRFPRALEVKILSLKPFSSSFPLGLFLCVFLLFLMECLIYISVCFWINFSL